MTPDRPLTITPITRSLHVIINKAKGTSYTVQQKGQEHECECEGFRYRGSCKHIQSLVDGTVELVPVKVGDRLNIFGKRHYLTPVGWLASVTTILGATKDEKAKENLLKWENKLVAQGLDPKKVSQRICDQGTDMHSWCEAKLKSELLPSFSCDRTNALIESISPVINRISNVVAQEQFVYWKDEKTGYGAAGSFDCFGAIDFNPDWVEDFKSSLKPKRIDWIRDYVLQCSAYSGGIYKCMGHRVNGAAVMIGIAGDDAVPQPAQVFKFPREQLLEAWKEWLLRLEQFYDERGVMLS